MYCSGLRLRRLLNTVAMRVVMAILLIINVTRHRLISASPSDVIVARQHHHQLTNGHLPQPATGKRWAPTEIRMNEFIHKIRSRINSQSGAGFARRAVRRTVSGQSDGAAGKILKNNRRAEKTPRGVKLYRLRTRWGRIPSAVNVGEN